MRLRKINSAKAKRLDEKALYLIRNREGELNVCKVISFGEGNGANMKPGLYFYFPGLSLRLLSTAKSVHLIVEDDK